MYIYQTMSNNFGYIDIILLAMIAGFIILRLRNISAIVFKAPIFWPIFIIKNISMAGTAIISNSTVFI